jgi:hypothetical protein
MVVVVPDPRDAVGDQDPRGDLDVGGAAGWSG